MADGQGEIVSTTGIFDGRIITVGNFDRVDVYEINDYFILPGEITPGQVDAYMGRRVRVTGKLRIEEGRLFTPKSSKDGRIYAPYKEPDKKFIDAPVFEVVDD